jgi:hypothetical protein
MHRTSQAALAGIAAAAAWVAVEPAWRRLLGGEHRELRLLGRLLAPESRWRTVGLTAHLANGAAFAVAFDRLGGRGVRQAVAAAQIENAVLWPAMAIVDRLHPDVRDGTWPSLADNPRAIAQEIAGHAVFGVVLGLLGPGARDTE